MSEMQRFDIRGDQWGIVERTDGLGAFCWYDDAAWYRRQYRMALVINIAVVLACAVLATLLVQEKAARGPVPVPTVASEQAGPLKDMQDLRAAKALAEQQRDDYKAMALNYKAQIRHLNERMSTLGQQIDIVQARGAELDRLNKAQAQRMSTQQGVVLEAKRILGPLGVQHIKVVE